MLVIAICYCKLRKLQKWIRFKNEQDLSYEQKVKLEKVTIKNQPAFRKKT
jgi:hypothetical protein